MKLKGTTTIKASRQKVWAFLTDAEAVSTCVPGLESLKIVTPDRAFKATAVVGLGTAKVRFVTDIEWVELNAPKRAVMKAHGDATGSTADMTAVMTLADGMEGVTGLAWEADVVVAGAVASLASRLMPRAVKMMTNTFFTCARKRIEGG